ncbi:hypothetical protein [Lonepinella sp. BR2357]|uniref:hypothetical protein n=1 Tax=Lonepinella sp. BR2357 TaxID=3434549 RepID=UPI003F6E15AA
MSIADIGKTMAMYAQPTDYDQAAWKKAFDIANSFTTAQNNRTVADENMRKLAENYATQTGRVNALNAQNQDLINQYGWQTKTRDATQQAAIDNSLSTFGLNTKQNQVALNGINDQEQLAKVQQQAILAGKNPDYPYLLNPNTAKQFSPAMVAALYGQQQQAQATHQNTLNTALQELYKNSFVESYDDNGNKITKFDPTRFEQGTKALYSLYPNDVQYIGDYFSRFNGYFMPQSTIKPADYPHIIGFSQLNSAYPAITGYTPPQPAVPYAVPQGQVNQAIPTPQVQPQQVPQPQQVTPQMIPTSYGGRIPVNSDEILKQRVDAFLEDVKNSRPRGLRPY